MGETPDREENRVSIIWMAAPADVSEGALSVPSSVSILWAAYLYFSQIVPFLQSPLNYGTLLGNRTITVNEARERQTAGSRGFQSRDRYADTGSRSGRY